MAGILQSLIGSLYGLITDAYFKYVTLLLPGNGTNGAQNNTFLDASTNNFTITRNGNTTQGTFAPYGANWSNYFGGTGNYFATASSSTNDFGTGDWTIEFWINSTQTDRADPFGWNYSFNSAGWGGFVFNLSTSGQMSWYEQTNQRINAAGTGWNNGAWNHVAVTRSGNNVRMFLNGTQVGSTYVTSFSYGANPSGFIVGAQSGGTVGTVLTGYISNLRLLKGTAQYTANFTPPTAPLTAITNTQLLTCQSNRFIDNSTNAFAITTIGTPSTQVFSPFSPTAAYAAGTIGGSGYFDGTGDYLSTTSTSAFALSGAFTLELWYYPLALSTSVQYPFFAETSTGGLFFILQFPNKGLSYGRSGIVVDYESGVYPKINAWNHIVLVRSGTGTNQTAIFLNGSRIANTTNATSYTATGSVQIAGITANNTWANGYISDLRLVNGTAVYDPTQTTLTVPTAPLTAISNTSYLLKFTNAGIIDNAMMNDAETVGNAQISTTQSKFGGSSMYFDGTGDYLVVANNPSQRLMAGDFTIEMWIYLGAAQANMGLVSSYSNSNGWIVRLDTTTVVFAYGITGSATVVSNSSSLSTSTWYHIAWTKSGTTLRSFVNGTQVGSNHTVSGAIDTTTAGLQVGRTQTVTNDFNGYIDDLRITKGYARYTADFTAPTSPFPLQ